MAMAGNGNGSLLCTMVMGVMSVNGGAAGRLSVIMFPPKIVRIPTLKRTYDIILAGILLRGLQRKKKRRLVML